MGTAVLGSISLQRIARAAETVEAVTPALDDALRDLYAAYNVERSDRHDEAVAELSRLIGSTRAVLGELHQLHEQLTAGRLIVEVALPDPT